MEGSIKLALIGAGMFGGDVHARAYAHLQRSGISPRLGRLGLDAWARELAPIRFELAAVATRTEKSARRAQADFHARTGLAPRAYWGEQPWLELLRDFPGLDVLAVATPDRIIELAQNRPGLSACWLRTGCCTIPGSRYSSPGDA